MTGFMPFQLLDELAFDQVIGNWTGIHEALGNGAAKTTGQLNLALKEWRGQGRRDFLQWWWGGDGTADVKQGAEWDVQILLGMIDDITVALSTFKRSVGSINSWLTKANLEVAEHTDASGRVTLKRLSGGSVNFEITGGSLAPQSLPGVNYPCYLHVASGEAAFPYTDQLAANNEMDGGKAPKWFLQANRYADNAAQEFNAACQGSISRLNDVRTKATRVHWLHPYKAPTGTAYGRFPYQDPAWNLMSGGQTERWPAGRPTFNPGDWLDPTWKDGQLDLVKGGDPTDPSAAVPPWYVKPDLFDTAFDIIKKDGLKGLIVGLGMVGLEEGAALIEAVADSSAFFGCVADAIGGESIAGAVLNGYYLTVDAGSAESVARTLAERMLAGHPNLANLSGELERVIEERIVESPEKDGRYVLNAATMTTPTAQQGQTATHNGIQAVLGPINSHSN